MLDSWKSAGLDYSMRSAYHPINEGLCYARHQNHTTVSIRCQAYLSIVNRSTSALVRIIGSRRS